jgi:hypothetical protein
VEVAAQAEAQIEVEEAQIEVEEVKCNISRGPELRKLAGRLRGDARVADGQAGYGDDKVANRNIRAWHGATENGPWMMYKSKHLGRKLDSGTIYNRAEGFWICPSFNRHSLSRSAKP